jgi:2-methylcitrate dehydratase PrpD
MARQHHIDVRAIQAIEVAASPPAVNMEAVVAPYLKGPESLATTLNFSLAYNVAAALTDRELTARQFARERIKDPAVWELVSKVRVSVDEEMARRVLDGSLLRFTDDRGQGEYGLDLATADVHRFKAAYGARVRIQMEDGRTFEMEEEIPQGGAGRQFDDRHAAVEDKFRRETRYTLRKERMERSIDLANHLEEAAAAQIKELVRSSCSERV